MGASWAASLMSRLDVALIRLLVGETDTAAELSGHRTPVGLQPILIDWPPSTGRITPVTHPASSDARNRAALATSQADP